MEYRLLGNTGIRVSALCAGTMSYGGIADEGVSKAMYKQCRDAGINFFDCANVYSKGRAEEILGDLIAGSRDDLVITTKVCFAMGSGVNDRGASRKNLVSAIHQSLRRLKTDYVDIYFLHGFDNDTPLEETLEALDLLVKEGKVLYIAASNFAAWQIAKALGISAMRGLSALQCIQPMYNLVKRQAESEILPMAQAERLGVITYSPLGGGLLTGKYHGDQHNKEWRLRSNQRYKLRYGAPEVHEIAGRFCAFARERGFDPSSLAVAWAAGHPAVTAPIIGARNPEQLAASLASVDIDMTGELWREIAALSYQPACATDRTEEETMSSPGSTNTPSAG